MSTSQPPSRPKSLSFAQMMVRAQQRFERLCEAPSLQAPVAPPPAPPQPRRPLRFRHAAWGA